MFRINSLGTTFTAYSSEAYQHGSLLILYTTEVRSNAFGTFGRFSNITSYSDFMLSIMPIEDFKSFLSTQYEAGTPVTVWYVLAEPEEEPLENLLPIQTIKGTNILTADTTVQPSEMYIKGKIKPIGGNEND